MDDGSRESNDGNSSQASEIVCNACGFEASYVPEGMMQCERCKSVFYCSLHCLQWDWKTGGHSKTCVDVRPEPTLEEIEAPPLYEENMSTTDDGTLASMDIAFVFGDKAVGKPTAPAVDTDAKESKPEPLSNFHNSAASSNSASSLNERKQMWEEKMKEAAATEPKPSSGGLGAFFDTQKKKPSTPVPAPPPPQRAGEEFIEEIIEEPSSTTDEDEGLRSIKEESSLSEEPDMEGSWRSREPFQIASANPLLGPDPSESPEAVVDALLSQPQTQSQASEHYSVEDMATDDEFDKLYDASESSLEVPTKRGSLDDSSGSVKRMREDPQGLSAEPMHDIADDDDGNDDDDGVDDNRRGPVDQQKADGGRSVDDGRSAGPESLKDFRSFYQEGQGGKAESRLSLKGFRDIYGADDEGHIPGIEPSPSSGSEETSTPSQSASKKSEGTSKQSEDGMSKKTTETSSSVGSNHAALKKSINAALRDYEKVYGKEAAKRAYVQLTTGLEEDNGISHAEKQAAVDAFVALSSQLDSVPPQEDLTVAIQQGMVGNDADGGVPETEPPAVGAAFVETSPPDERPEPQPSSPSRRGYLSYRSSMASRTPPSSQNQDRTSESTGGPAAVLTPMPIGRGKDDDDGEALRVALRPASSPMPITPTSQPRASDIAAASPSESGPRYLRYRSSLSNKPSPLNSAGNSDNQAKPPRMPGTDSSPSEESDASGGGGGVAASPAVIASTPASSSQLDHVVEDVSNTPSRSYMKYRSSLAQKSPGPTSPYIEEIDLEEEKKENQPVASRVVAPAVIGAAAATAVASKSVGDETPPPRYLRYRELLSKSPTKKSSVATDGTGLKSDEPQSVPEAHSMNVSNDGGKVSALPPMPALDESETPGTPISQAETISKEAPRSSSSRYSKYRSALSTSAVQPKDHDKEDASESTFADVWDDADRQPQSTSRVAPAAQNATVIASAMGPSDESESHTESSAVASPIRAPRYMQYRNSLAQNASVSRNSDSQNASVSRSSEPPSESTFDGDDERKRNSRAAVGAVAVAGATAGATAGIVAATNDKTEVPEGGPKAPRYMKYRNSLSQNSPVPRNSDSLRASLLRSSESPGKTPDDDERKRNDRAAAAGAVAATGAVAAATAGVVVATKDSPDALDGGANEAAPSYKKYRESLIDRLTQPVPVDASSSSHTDGDDVNLKSTMPSALTQVATQPDEMQIDYPSEEESLDATDNFLPTKHKLSAQSAALPTASVLAASPQDSEGSSFTANQEIESISETPSFGKPAPPLESGPSYFSSPVDDGDGSIEDLAYGMPPKQVSYSSLEDSRGKRMSFRNVAVLLCLLVVLGAIAIGIGVGVSRSGGSPSDIAPTMNPAPEEPSHFPTPFLRTPTPASPVTPPSPEPARPTPTPATLPPSISVPEEAPTTAPTVTPSMPSAAPSQRTASPSAFSLAPSPPTITSIPTVAASNIPSTLDGSRAPSVTPISAPPTTRPSPPPISSEPTVAPSTNIPTPSPTTVEPSSAPTTTSPTLPPSTQDIPTQSPTTVEPSSAPTTASPTLSPSTQEPSTSSPTATPTSGLERELLTLIALATDGDTDSVKEVGTPQYEAFQWLLASPSTPDLADARRLQRYALATFYFSTEGEQWTNSAGWLTEDNECTWFSRSTRSPVCGLGGVFTNLDLGFNEVGGSIPPEIALLSGLTRIGLSGGAEQKIGGPLPTEIGRLSLMQSFDLFGNAVSGPIPPEIGSWSLAEIVILSTNAFDGNIPESVGDMTLLRELNLADNFLSGELSSRIAGLQNLEKLSLHDNELSGAIPSEIGLLQRMMDLNLGNNRFTSLPSEMGLLRSLENFSVYGNGITGPFFSEMSLLSNLRRLHAQGNSFDGPIPSEIGLLANLRALDFSSNEFTGFIPPEIGGLVNVITLELQSNRLTGQVPVAFASLTRLSTVRVDDNDLEGPLPDEVCDEFVQSLPQFYLDCGGDPPEIACPPGTCCTYCCEDGVGCECVFANSGFEFLC